MLVILHATLHPEPIQSMVTRNNDDEGRWGPLSDLYFSAVSSCLITSVMYCRFLKPSPQL
jgi:hypothetical protein